MFYVYLGFLIKYCFIPENSCQIWPKTSELMKVVERLGARGGWGEPIYIVIEWATRNVQIFTFDNDSYFNNFFLFRGNSAQQNRFCTLILWKINRKAVFGRFNRMIRKWAFLFIFYQIKVQNRFCWVELPQNKKKWFKYFL